MTDAAPAANRQDVIEFKSRVTGRVSDSTRIVGFGLMAVYFTLMLTDGDRAEAFRNTYWLAIYLTGVLGILTVALDYLHYVCASISAKTALDSADILYDRDSQAYLWQGRFYRWKQITAIAGALTTIFFMALPFGLPIAD